MRSVKFSLSVLFFWIKGSISVDDKTVKVHSRNTLLGIIPAGGNNQTIPVNNISATDLTTSFKIKPMIIGVVFFAIAISFLTDNSTSFISSIICFIIFGLIGFSSFANGFLTLLVIQRGGSDFYVSVPFYEKKKILDIKDAIDELVYEHLENTNVKKATEKSTDEIVRAIKEK